MVVKKSSKNFKQLVYAIGYALVFAVPEEIIFRGIIQSHFQSKTNAVLAILIASAFTV